MVPVYDAAHSTDAHLVKNLLEQAGIASYIRGEYLQGGLGDIPVSGMMQVCVDAGDAAQARAIIDDWESGAPPMAEDGPDDAIEPPAVPAGAIGKSGFGRILFAVVFGAALGAGLMWLGLRGPAIENAYDYNGDGKPDERLFYAGDVLKRVENDRNYDGKIDATVSYAADGSAAHGESDNDFDGRMETKTRYLHGQWQSEESDDDGDGVFEYQADAISGVVYSQQWLDTQGRISKRVQYKGNVPITGEIDTDKDGILDTRRFYDSTGEITRSEKM